MPSELTSQTFRALSVEQQTLLVWHEGTFLACRWNQQQTVGLYHMGRFFCEVYYDPETNEIQHLLSFTNGWCLEAYLDYISLKDIEGS